MFALRSSPDAGDKRKRPVADSEPPRRPTSPLTRLSPPTGHRSVQALAKRQSMPFLNENPRGGAGWEQTTFSSQSDTNVSAKTGHTQAQRFTALKSASEPRETRLPVNQPREEYSSSQTHFGRTSNEEPPIRLSTEDTIVASPAVIRSNDGKTGRGQAHGAVKKSAKDTSQKKSSVHTASPRTSVKDQRADKGKRPTSKTTWDAALDAHACLREAFPARPNNDTVTFLADLPAAEGALDESPKLDIVNGQLIEKGFALSRTQPWKEKRLQAALAQSHGILSESPCSRCAAGKGVYTTCVRAPTRPGKSQDVFGGACVNCFYSGLKNKCECRNRVNFKQGAGTPTTLMTSDDPPLEEQSERHQGEAQQNALPAPPSEDEIPQGDAAQSMPANRKDAQDSKHRLQDQVVKYAYRVRLLPLEKRQAVTEQIESLLGEDGFEPDVLDIVRRVYDLPEEERAQSSKMILQILRGLLV